MYLAFPNHLHKRYASAALRKGSHVLCEEPSSQSVSKGKAIIRAAEEGGAKLMVAYRLQFDEANLHLISLGQSGRLGDLRIVHSLFTQQVRK